MTITYRDTKGSDLIPSEVDANFRHVLDSANQSFTASGSGAVSESTQTVIRNGFKNTASYGTVANSASNQDTTFEDINANHTGIGHVLVIPPGTYTVEQARLDNPITYFFNGALLKTTVNTNQVFVVGDTTSLDTKVGSVALWNPKFNMPTPPDDNRAAFNCENAEAPFIFGGYSTDVATLVRFGHADDGTHAVTEHGLALGATVKNAYSFVTECIGGGWNRVIGMLGHNDGVASGTTSAHGVRWAGFTLGTLKRGNLAVANIMRDRGGNGLSIQEYQENGLAVGNVFDNCQYGVRADLSNDVDGRHLVGQNVVRNATIDGIDISRLSGCSVSGLIDRPAATGFRMSSTTHNGRYDLNIQGAGTVGARLNGTSNLITATIHDSTNENATIAGSFNVVVIASDDGLTNACVTTSGDDNILVVSDDSGTTGRIQIDSGADRNIGVFKSAGDIVIAGDDNDVTLNAVDDLTLSGSNNRIYGRCDAISVSGNDNHIYCHASGSITDTGHGNVFYTKKSTRFGTVSLADDFLGDVLADQWNVRKGSDGACVDFAVLADQQRGLIRATTGAGAGVSMAANGVQLESGLNWKASQGGLILEARVDIDVVANMCLFVGFTDQNSALEMPITLSVTTFTPVATDLCGFLWDTAATTDTIRFVGVANGVEATHQDSSIALNNAQFRILRVEISSTGTARFFVDGTQTGSTMSGAVTAGTSLTPVLCAFSRNAASHTVDCDYLLVEANR